MIAELLSGSAPPVEFFNPAGFLILTSLYGSGAIVVRELVIRWDKGWTSLLILGAAYAILEEGLMVKSIFDPAWMDLGALATFGRWAGVNWVWAVMLTIYHATFSIAIPILLVELMFSSRREFPWVGRKAFRLLVLLISVVAVIGFAWLTPYRPPIPQYLGAVAATIALGYGAWKLPHQPKPRDWTRGPVGPRRLALFAFAATLCFFMLLYAGPFLTPFPIVMIVAAFCLVALVGMLLTDFGSRGLAESQEFALAAGALGFLILLAPLQEFDKTRTDNAVGMSLVGLSFLVFLVLLGRRIGRRSKVT